MFKIVEGILFFEGQVLTLDEAFEASIKKWEFLRDYYRDNSHEPIKDGGIRSCGLCMLFWENNCKGCPIAETGHAGCVATPYEEYQDIVDKDSFPPSGIPRNEYLANTCEDEIRLLKRIRDEHKAAPMFRILNGKLVFEGTVSTLDEAFAVSIKKWETLRDYYLSDPEKIIDEDGKHTCGLCHLFLGIPFSANQCKGCPVAEAGHIGCEGTPYIEYCKNENCITEYVTCEDYNDLAQICEDEVEFLRAVRDKEI
jgi:hypothetical protein